MPGIGVYTAPALLAFVFNQPSIVIDTNIRRVFIHSFFKDRDKVDDKELLPYLEKSVNTADPKSWYYALMDYGAFLGKADKTINKQSSHYKKQSVFKGSHREIRGEIIPKRNERSELVHS